MKSLIMKFEEDLRLYIFTSIQKAHSNQLDENSTSISTLVYQLDVEFAIIKALIART